MVEPFAEMLVHYKDGQEAASIAGAIVDAWRLSTRPPLVIYPKSGAGIEPSASLLRSRLTFDQDQQAVSLTLRTSRALRGADRVQFYFTNPAHNYSRPPNFVAVSFFHEGIPKTSAGYSENELQALLMLALSVGRPLTGWLERSEVIHHPEIQRASSGLAVLGIDHMMPYWLSVLPARAVNAALACDRAGLVEVRTLAELTGSSVLARIGAWPPEPVAAHVRRLLIVLGAIEHDLELA